MEGFRARKRSEKPHTHGCSQTPHPYQAASWAVSLIFVGCFYLMVLPILPRSAGVVGGLLYSLNSIYCVTFGLLATLTDPTDLVVLAERRAKKLKIKFDSSKYDQICTICKTHVHDYSKHCGQCDRCVDGFDHHCKWLNNCIGKRNYLYFALLLAGADCQLCLEIVLTAYVTHGLISGEMTERLEDVYGIRGKATNLYAGLLTGLLVLLAVCFCALLQLILLHIWLRARGLTTYEFIILQRQRKKAANHRRVQPSLDPLRPFTTSLPETPKPPRSRLLPASSVDTKEFDSSLMDDKTRIQ